MYRCMYTKIRTVINYRVGVEYVVATAAMVTGKNIE